MTHVTIKDMRSAGVCAKRRTREWFKLNNLDFKDFVRNGIDAQKLLDTGDNQTEIKLVIAEANKREANNGRR